MKHTLILLAALATLGAHATDKPPAPSGPTANQRVGITSITAALSASRSSSRSASSATGGAATAYGGLGGAGGIGQGGLGGAGGSLDMAGARIGSDVSVERSAPSLYGATPTQPTQPCARPGFSIGGSGRDGGGLISVPTGSDETCRIGNALTLMDRNPDSFTREDRLAVTCKQEDVADTPTCKRLNGLQPRQAQAAAREPRQPMPWQAGG